jgi:hypothetical protein
MDLRNFRKAAAIGAIALTSVAAQKALAAPVFTFSEKAGFAVSLTGVENQTYDGPALAVGGQYSDSTPLYSAMSWGYAATAAGKSGLSVATYSGSIGDGWTTISTLYHYNNTITHQVNGFNQLIVGRFQITDSDGGNNLVVDSNGVDWIDYTETPNAAPCEDADISVSICDDIIQLSPTYESSLAPLEFFANDFTKWNVEFQLVNISGVTDIFGRHFTAEGTVGAIAVQARVFMVPPPPPPIPEPASLGLFSAVLVGLGLINRRKRKV